MNIKRLRHSHRLVLIAAMMALAADAAAQSLDLRVLQQLEAHRKPAMTMKEWAEHLDNILTMSGEKLLQGAGKVSHQEAIEHATNEYKKYQQRTLSQVEKDFLENIKSLPKKLTPKPS
ncbi:MAG: virulence RhuM family protein [Bacteroidales bacterium]|nr:virulence RhuM family protein [Bacteroidales bacterium]